MFKEAGVQIKEMTKDEFQAWQDLAKQTAYKDVMTVLPLLGIGFTCRAWKDIVYSDFTVPPKSHNREELELCHFAKRTKGNTSWSRVYGPH